MYDDICFFVQIADAGKFSIASEKLGVDKSTISRRINELEHKLKLELIKRDSHNMELTEYGKNLYEQFKDTQAEVNCMVNQAKIERNNSAIRLVLPQGLANFGLSSKLLDLREEFPGLMLHFFYYVGAIDIENMEYDLAIVTYANKKEEAAAKKIYSSKVILVCSPTYIDNHGLLNNIEEMPQHLVLGSLSFLKNNVTPRLFNEVDGSSIDLSNDFQIYLNNFAEAKQLAKTGRIITGLPESDIVTELASGELVRLLPEYHAGYIFYFMVSRYDQHDSRYQRISHIIEKFFDNYIN